MAIQLSEEAFALLYSLRQQLDRIPILIDTDPARAKQELAEASKELGEWIGPGIPQSKP